MTDQLPLPVTGPFSKAQRAMLANLIARAAQAEILPRFRKLDSGQIATKSGPTDLVTQADIAAEAMIARGLQMAFPSAVIVGEESVESMPNYRKKLEEAELGFLIDPIDGTWNYANGMPLFGTMIAACRFGRPVFGLIYDPVGRDLIWADIDTPTTWVPRAGRARKLQTRGDCALDEMTGYVEMSAMPMAHKRATAKAIVELHSASTLRCSAHQYRLLAQGAVDFVMGTKLNPWDHAPGVILTKQAGGYSAMLDGTPYTTSKETGYLLSATNEVTWNMLADHFSALLSAA